MKVSVYWTETLLILVSGVSAVWAASGSSTLTWASEKKLISAFLQHVVFTTIEKISWEACVWALGGDEVFGWAPLGNGVLCSGKLPRSF